MRWLAVHGDRQDERFRLRVVEEVDAGDPVLGAAEVRLRIEAGVPGPHLEVAAGELHVEARYVGGTHPWLVERVAERDLANLHVAAVLDELAADRAEAAAVGGEPVRAAGHAARRRGRTYEIDGLPRAGTGDRSLNPVGAEHVLSLPSTFGVEVRAEGVEGPLGAVPHLPAAPDVHHRAETQLPDRHGVGDAGRPLRL